MTALRQNQLLRGVVIIYKNLQLERLEYIKFYIILIADFFIKTLMLKNIITWLYF